ncbi:MAG: GGDEF domain-containing protein [Sporomusaceae bacterium]|nr:GGDEF domain-containing protein [Sporomusaceae bacterium]
MRLLTPQPEAAHELDSSYREHYLAKDARQTIIAIAVWMLPVLPFSYGDYIIFGASTQFAALLALRLIFCAFSVYTIRALAKVATARDYDTIFLRWAVFGIVVVTYFNYIWAQHIPPNGALTILVIFSSYMVFPVRLAVRLAPPLILSAANFCLQWLIVEPISPQALFALLATLITANILGIVFSTWLQNYRLVEFKARQEENKVKEELSRLAATDDLTGALNRRKIMELATWEYERFLRERRPLSVVMIDVDRFKKLNDTYGHEAGDLILTSFTAYVAKSLRREDIWGRLGGDEFVLILPDTPVEQAAAVAERLCLDLSEPVLWQGQELSFTISCGVTAGQEKDRSIDHVFTRADKALYSAKRKGRNRVETM